MRKPRGQLTVTVGDKGRITLSEEVRSHLRVSEGDVVLIELAENGIAQMVPATLIPRDQVWFAHPEMQSRIREAHGDIAAGRTTRASKSSDLRAHLGRVRKVGRGG